MKNEEDKENKEEEKVSSDITGFYSPDISISLKLQKKFAQPSCRTILKSYITIRQLRFPQKSLWNKRKAIWNIGF